MSGRFRSRPTRPLGIVVVNGWKLKRYEITLDGDPVPKPIHTGAEETLVNHLPGVPPAEIGAGFVVLHLGAESVWLLADLWTGDIISQHTFVAPLEDPGSFEPVPAGGPTACVWELKVHSHERNAYVHHILDPASGPDQEGYFADTLAIGWRSERDLVAEFNRAWVDADVDRLMSLLTDDPVYRASTGTEPGTTYTGAERVREGFAAVIEAELSAGDMPDASEEIHILGDRGLSFWSYPVKRDSGDSALVEGVDVWTFQDGRIAIKDAYRKSFPDPEL